MECFIPKVSAHSHGNMVMPLYVRVCWIFGYEVFLPRYPPDIPSLVMAVIVYSI